MSNIFVLTGLVGIDNNRSGLVKKSNFVNKLKSVQSYRKNLTGTDVHTWAGYGFWVRLIR